MKKQGVFIFLILFIFCMFSPVKGFTAEEIGFKSYEKGIELIKNSKKKGFLYFRAGW